MDAKEIALMDSLLIDSSQQGVIVFGQKGTIVRSNLRAEHIISWIAQSGTVASETDILRLFNINPLHSAQTNDRQELHFGSTAILVMRHRLSVFEKTMVAYFLQDITGQKMQAASIHEQMSDILWYIRSRITSVQNAFALFKQNEFGGADEEMRDLMHESQIEIWRISDYLDKLHNLSLLNANTLDKHLDIEECDIRELINEALQNIAVFTEHRVKRVALVNNISRKTLIRCDRQRSVRIIESIVTNAIIFACPKVRITFFVSRQADDSVALHISDDGIGIPKSEQMCVFNYGFRGTNAVNNEFTGMGISLHLARKIMDRMQGAISFKSKGKRGSTFSVVFKKQSRKSGKKDLKSGKRHKTLGRTGSIE